MRITQHDWKEEAQEQRSAIQAALHELTTTGDVLGLHRYNAIKILKEALNDPDPPVRTHW